MDIAGWEEMYRSGERGAEDQPTPLLRQTVAGLQPATALDLACGAGRNALFLAELGWTVTAIDGSPSAIQKLKAKAAQRALQIQAEVADLTRPDFNIENQHFDLIVIAYYLQRDLFPKIMPALKAQGTVLAIVHIPDPGEPWTEKRAAPGELRSFFEGWNIPHYYEGPSRDAAHKRPVAEIVAQRTNPGAQPNPHLRPSPA